MYQDMHHISWGLYRYIDGIEQDCSISIGNILEILQSCTKPSISIILSVTRIMATWHGNILPNCGLPNIDKPLQRGCIALVYDKGFHYCCCREALIRTAFQCLQLVITDFLPIMPCECLLVCVDVASRFGLQTQELNISLTAIGLLVRWTKEESEVWSQDIKDTMQ